MRPVTLPSVLAISVLLASPRATQDPLIRGFSAASAKEEMRWETTFRALPSRDSLRSYLQLLSARPHHIGTAYGKANAEWIRDRLISWGWDAKIENFDVLFPTPLERVVELVGPVHFKARLQEPSVAGDPSSSQHTEQLPTYNAYSIDGDVTAPLVYVNYGVPGDYETLARHGISVKGAIVIVRYGGSWRGIKPKLAGEHGAVGCIIYSDPRDDGYHAGDVYPKGAWRPADGVQRGSVMDMPVQPGDPLTPGVGAVAGTPRVAISEAITLTKIPVLPISYRDAEPLLRAISGQAAPEDWQGGLPITYHIGPGAARVHLKLRFDWKTVTLNDVIAKIPGSTEPDHWVIRGNHHDAWVNGAQDPLSGQISLLEEARALGTLLKQGWRPRRTIIYAAWDGEEEGLLGSTEWVEAHAAELAEHAVSYINTDVSSRGFLGMGGSHVLERFINDVAKDITDPETQLPAWKRVQLQTIANTAGDDRSEARSARDLHINALGSGSDFTPFLQHAGIASLDLGFGGEGGGGIYHSIYDDFSWFTRFDDTSFAYGQALAQTVGTAMMRLADAEVIPFEFTRQAQTFRTYMDELKKLLSDKQDEAAERNRQLDEGLFQAMSDPQQPSTLPARLDTPPHLNFAPLENALDQLSKAADHYELAMNTLVGDSAARWPSSAINQLLLGTERALLHRNGLPGRPWFQHLVYAPGLYTGYGVKTMPGVREGIEQRKWQEAEQEIARVAESIAAEARLVESASTELEKH
ncbi:MAG: transferrin receptor-like dimerization domain-containing protein [Gemmatimonadota bacterium]